MEQLNPSPPLHQAPSIENRDPNNAHFRAHEQTKVDPFSATENELSRHDSGDTSLPGSERNSTGPDEAIFDDYMTMAKDSSSHTEEDSEQDDISELPTGSRVSSYAKDQRHASPFSPIKTRSPFRNPSSVKGIQLDITPPPYLVSSASQQRYKLGNPSRNGTPRSVRSNHSSNRSPTKFGSAKRVQKEHPLVLLHVTMLPITLPYTQEIMEAILPGYIIDNYKLLREKATDTVLERGIIIPHPREEYELLEERLLESLELKIPRILKCGHFHRDSEDEEVVKDAMHDDESDRDGEICDCCGCRIKDGVHGSGTGSIRWDIKIYAANGLMRAGAWRVAWKEMERVDVEILPWMDATMKRELDLRMEEELARLPPANHPDNTVYEEPSKTNDERLREIYGDNAQAFIDGLQDKGRTQKTPSVHREGYPDKIPLGILLKNYLHLVLQDRRNMVIVTLGFLVLWLSVWSGPRPASIPAHKQFMPPPFSQVADVHTIPAHSVPSARLGTVITTPIILSAISDCSTQSGPSASQGAAISSQPEPLVSRILSVAPSVSSLVNP